MTAAITYTDAPVLRAAHGLVTSYLTVTEAAPRTKALAVALARFNGQVDMLHRLGFIPTPFAGEIAIVEAVRAAGPRPDFRFAGSNDDVFAWDRAVAGAVAATFNTPSL